MPTSDAVMHPTLEPFAHGFLPVAHDNDIYWETSGNPHGEPLIYLHGGPGSGLGAGGYRRRADPSRYLIVGIDQRGCGRSRPLVTDDLGKLRYNTTQALIDDIEAVREHLGVERWVLHGVSWGSTLALAYAQAHPERVRAIVLVAVTTTSRDEVEWITDGVGRIFPEAWQRFADASARRSDERVVDAYARRLANPKADPDDRERAAADWDEWESQHIRLDPLWTPDARHEDSVVRRVFATLVTHYWSHDAFLVGPDAIANRVERIAHIPGTLIHGRHDVSGPVITAWRLHQRWSASRLIVIESEGHGGAESMAEMARATDALDPAS
jgi:proline iminopeptidase